MDRIETEKTYPQKVEVINELSAKVVSSSDNPLLVTLPSPFFGGSGSNMYLKTTEASPQNAVYIKPWGNAINGYVSCVHVVNNSYGYVFPINQDFFNIANSTTFETAIIPSLHSSFEQKFPSATSIIVFYSYQTPNRLYTFGSYSGQS